MASLTPISGTLGRKRAAHLLRRATFGCNRETIDNFAQMTVSQAVTALLDFPAVPSVPVSGTLGSSNNVANAFHPDGRLKAGTGQVNRWWFYQNIDPNQPPTSYYRLVFFLHTCCTVAHEGMQTYWYYHLYLLLKYADKSYKTLVRKMCQDHAMGKYLNIGDNTNVHPNENFARELLELFTLGKGPQIGPGNYTNYTEDDIREAARVLTGWRYTGNLNATNKMDPDLGWVVMFPATTFHDSGNKQFSAVFQNQVINGQNTNQGMAKEVDELVDMIFKQDAVSEFIMRKLYRYFVHYDITPEVEADIIEPLAQAFRQNNFEFIPVIKMLLESSHFYDEDDTNSGDEILGGMIKSPLELYLNTMNFFQTNTPDPTVDLAAYYEWMEKRVDRFMEKMGFSIFNPTSVAGYEPMYQEPDFNRYWINPSLLPNRYDHIFSKLVDVNNMPVLPEGMFNILDYIQDPANVSVFQGADPKGIPGPHEGARIADHLVHEIVDYLLPVTLDTDRFDYFRDELLLDNLSPINWMFEWDNFKATGNAANIYPQLVKLIRGILQSPEYQLA